MIGNWLIIIVFIWIKKVCCLKVFYNVNEYKVGKGNKIIFKKLGKK